MSVLTTPFMLALLKSISQKPQAIPTDSGVDALCTQLHLLYLAMSHWMDCMVKSVRGLEICVDELQRMSITTNPASSTSQVLTYSQAM